MKRRHFLAMVSATTLGQLVAGCRSNAALRVMPLKSTVPAQLVSNFQKSLGARTILEFTPKLELKELFALLQDWQRPTPHQPPPSADDMAHLVMIGDYWLAKAIEQKLIQPLDVTKLPTEAKLLPPWQTLVRRNDQGLVDPQGKIWAAPYLWGSTLIVYRTDKMKALGWTPQDWSDLWREELKQQISLPNQLREVIGLTLKKLGHSYNTEKLETVKNLKEELRHLRQNVKFYSSNSYLQPLLTGDSWLAVGWSTDILPLLKNQKDIAAIVPQSGTALWADLWVKPAAAANVPLVEKWIEFCWQPQVATQLSLLTDSTSPMILGMQPEELPTTLQKNHLLLPAASILEKSEFLYPLPQSTQNQYRTLWEASKP